MELLIVQKNDKGLFSIFTSESKHWLQFRAQKIYSLWLNYYFTDYRYIIEKVMTELEIPFNRFDAYDFHFGWMAVLKTYA